MTDWQGTRWESDLRDAFKKDGFMSDRYPKRGQKGEPDLWVCTQKNEETLGILAWKRLVGKRSAKERRKPDGIRDVVVMSLDDFRKLLPYVPYDFDIQAKWTARLNVTRTLAELHDWLKENR